MPNIISSAITNKPPPKAVADLLARRNKIHHLDSATDETLLEIFNHDPGMDAHNKANGSGITHKTANTNHSTMPSRNYAIIAESHDFSLTSNSNNSIGAANGQPVNGDTIPPHDGSAASKPKEGNGHRDKNPRHPIHAGEEHAGTEHPAASGVTQTGLGGQYGLDVTLRVEISKADRGGTTQGYGFTIPGLECGGYAMEGKTW
jgi:hypothetical protein